MSVSTIQATQTQPSTATAAQGSGGGSTADLFAYLLKHSYEAGFGQHSLLNTQSMLDMVGTAPTYTPPPQATPAAPLPTQTNTTQAPSNTTATQPAAAATVAAANPNGGRNSGGGNQPNNNSSQGQQGSTQSNTAPTTTTQIDAPAAAKQTTSPTGDDATTEETAAVLGAAAYVAPQAPTPKLTIDPTTAIGTAQNTGAPQQLAAAATAAPTANQAAPTTAATPVDDTTPDETTPWSANFLNAAATTPQVAQQAAGLAQITGSSSASVSVQTTSGTSVAAPSASALVPDAVMAVPGFLANGQQDASTGGDTGDQADGQQTAGDSALDGVTDPTAMELAEGAQAMSALSALLQTATQALAIPQQQAAAANIAATTAVTTAAAEAALPQPTTTTPATTANASNFVTQLQDAEETQAPQTAKAIALPSAIEQLKMQIEKGLQQGSTTIKVQLNPDNLGRVDVKLDVQNGTVKANITADRPETLALLKNDQAGLVQALQDAGLNADSSSLSFSLRGDPQQQQFAQSGRQSRGQNGSTTSNNDSLLAGVAATSGASSALSTGNLDISV